jgi:hypothetical protein
MAAEKFNRCFFFAPDDDAAGNEVQDTTKIDHQGLNHAASPLKESLSRRKSFQANTQGTLTGEST